MASSSKPSAPRRDSSDRTLTSSTGKIQGSLTTLGDACGVALLLGNHAKFGLAERCCYHFDLIETLTSLPTERAPNSIRGRDRGDSLSSHDGGESNFSSSISKETANNSTPNVTEQPPEEPKLASFNPPKACYCGVVSLLECIPSTASDSRVTKRALRSKHREFNTRAQKAWGRAHIAPKRQTKSASNIGEGYGNNGSLRHCHQPRHLPLPLNPNTRVTFAYELTSIAIVVDASPSMTAATFLNESYVLADGCCVPLDRLGSMLKLYLKGLIQPIEMPPVSVTGQGVAFGRWTPNLAITVVAAFPPSFRGDCGSARMLVRDFRVRDEKSALELVHQVEKWALHNVEGVIADRLGGERSHFGNGLGGRSTQGKISAPNNLLCVPSKISSWTNIRSSMKDILAVGDAALATLPPEGRPVVLVVSDCLNVHCGSVFDHLAETSRSDVPISVVNLSNTTSVPNEYSDSIYASLPIDVSEDSKSLRDACLQTGGIYLDVSLLDSYVNMNAGSSACMSAPFHGDVHFTSKKRSIRPNALQWYSLFCLSPLTPGYSSHSPTRSVIGNSRTTKHQPHDSMSTFDGQSFEVSRPFALSSNLEISFSTQAAALSERTFFVKYNINPVRVKSLLMSRILEGYRARKYGQNTQDPDKVSIHMTLKLSDCGVTLHYEVSFVSSPYHVPTVGAAYIKLELSGDDTEFILFVKNNFHGVVQQGRSISSIASKAADKICRLLKWVRKEDYLETYLCLPGWGQIDYFSQNHSFLRRLETLTTLQRHRHFRSETIEVVTSTGQKELSQSRAYALFSDLMENDEGEDNLYDAILSWASRVIVERTTYVKVLPARNDDLTYYLNIHVLRCSAASRLFTITMDFHGELDAEDRLGIVASFRERLDCYDNVVVLEKSISGVIAVRPKSRETLWRPRLAEYFLHHRSWSIIKDPEVLPLITKRRNLVGKFMILNSEEKRALFAKFSNGDTVVYQVLLRPEGIFVDIHMEPNRGLFNPFFASDSTFRAIYEKVKTKDMECAKNLHARSNLIQALDCSSEYTNSQPGDVLRLINISSRTERRLRFFRGNSLANDLLFHMTCDFITSGLLKQKTAKLSVNGNVADYSGQWFLMRLDWYVLSAIHLSTLTIEEAKNSTFSHLIFFTAGISTLYPNDDTKTEDVVIDDDDFYGLDLILHDIEQAHGKNYALALYQSLREPDFNTCDLSEEDVAYALSFCTFKTVLKKVISVDDLSDQLGSHVETMTGIKLCDLLSTLLNQVPMSDGQIFYCARGGDENGIELLDCVSIQENDIGSSHLSRHSNDEDSDAQYHDDEPSQQLAQSSPVFFRIALDGTAATEQHIRSIKKSTTFELAVSIFDNQNVSPAHLSVISVLNNALNSFTAEQQLESYRFHGTMTLSEEDLCTISKILPQTKHLSTNVPLSFFAAKTKSLIPASNPTGSTEHDLEHGYSTLLTQLQDWCTLKASNSSFLALENSEPIQLIPYWCFVQVSRSTGTVVIKVFHPNGNEAAQGVIERTREKVIKTCHRTNQLLLLQDLYKTKTACTLLIAESEDVTNQQNPNCSSEATFACPIQYRETMELNSRSTPRQAIDSLTSSTLHNFLISNRRRMFAYKDADNSIFYMQLREMAPAVELCVHGLTIPGPSITHQLVSLLKRSMLVLPLNAISSVLMKNPYYALNEEDVEFLRQFNDQMSQLDSDYTSSSAKSRRSYALPSHIRDPLLILLLFRRNITGSTFIHHLHEQSRDDNSLSLSDIIDEVNGGMHTFHICIPSQEFTFFFNSTPSQLDPNYQTVSTLTERGKQFSREAGSGIAIIELSLVDKDGQENIISLDGKRGQIRPGVAMKDIILQSASDDAHPSFKFDIDISNTTVDIDVLHKWVELSLNQVLLTWHIETVIDQSKKLQNVLPQLPILEDTMKMAIKLPHPAVGMCRNKRMIRAKSLAAITLQMNEMVLSSLCQKSKMTTLPGVSTIRRSKHSCIVTIKRDPISKDSVIVTAGGKSFIDKTIDNHEYISVFGLGSFDQFSVVTSSQLFFKEAFDVRPTQNTAFTQAMAMVKKKYPSLFTRHVAFILRVSRSSRTLLGYNMHPQIWSTIKQRFIEIDDAMSKQDEMHMINLQAKCGSVQGCSNMPAPAPLKPITTPKPENTPVDETKQDKPNASINQDSAMRGPKRRIPRPTSMLRPKLIGKSVEGSAMQAVKASRLRASSRPLPPQRAVSSGKVSAPPRDKEKRSKKTSSATKDTLSSQHHLLPLASQTKLVRDISAMMKVAHLPLPNAKINQSSIQLMLDSFLQYTKKDSEVQLPLVCVFVNCYSNFLGTWSIEHLTCDNETSVIPFLDQLTKSLSSKGMVLKSHSGSNNISPLLIAKELASNSDHQATIILQISMTRGSNKTIHIFCRAWLVNTANHNSNRKGLKPFVRQKIANRKGAIIEDLVEDFVTYLDLDLRCKVLNYAGRRLASAAKGVQVQVNLPSTVALLRSAILRFQESQLRKCDGVEYHLQRRFLCPSTFLQDLPENSFQKPTMCSFLLENCKEYHLLYCGRSQDPCFVGSLKVVGLVVHFFITWHETVRSAFDVFVLTETKGQQIDLFVGKEGSPYAEKLSHIILYSTMGVVQKLLRRAALDQRRQHLWSLFGKDYQLSSSINEHEVVEMIETSHKIPMACIDQRVKSFFDTSELQIPWRELFVQINQTPPFTHCISFSVNEATFHVVYVKPHDLYLSFKMQNEMFTETCVLFRNKNTNTIADTENEQEVSSASIVEQFTYHVTKWLFSSCCLFSVA